MTIANGTGARPILVLGDGPVGLAAALALAHREVEVLVIGPGADSSGDRRTSALMAASVTMLQRLDVWPSCSKEAAPLIGLRLIDDTGRLVRAPTVEFDAREIGEFAFGWNVPNSALVAALRAACARSPLIELHSGRVESITPGAEGLIVRLADRSEIATALLVGADGRTSSARRAADIGVREWSYDQSALVANLVHDKPHDHVSSEFHRRPGPFTLVPLPGKRSSLVWVESRRVAQALASLGPEELAMEVERLSHRLLGRVGLEGPVGLFPLAGLTARRFAARRIALVGEAAHVMPPIGAQGLNLGLRDVATLADVIGDAARRSDDPGSAPVLAAYDRARRLDIMTRSGAVDLLNRSLLSDLVPAQMLRAAGLAALARVGPLRRMFMREGVAPHLALPQLMRREDTETA